MLIGIVVGAALLVALALAYDNRDDLAGPPRGRELALYLAGVVVSIGVGVALAIVIAHGKDACGPPGGTPGSRCD